jgi:hypothetical protein
MHACVKIQSPNPNTHPNNRTVEYESIARATFLCALVLVMNEPIYLAETAFIAFSNMSSPLLSRSSFMFSGGKNLMTFLYGPAPIIISPFFRHSSSI